METVLVIAYHILMIGGALCIILLFVFLLVALKTMIRINNVVADINYKYTMLQQFIMSPLKRIGSFFEDDDLD